MKKTSLHLSLFLALLGVALGKQGSPEQQVDALFQQLVSEKRSTAFQDFFAGGLVIAQKPAEIKGMDAQASGAWAYYGAPVSYEIFQRTEIGKSLFRIKWLTKNRDEVPLFWSALFYYRAGAWEPFGILFFDSPEKAGI